MSSPFLSAATSSPRILPKLKIGGYLATCQRRKTPLKFKLGIKGRHFVSLSLIFLDCKYRRRSMFYRGPVPRHETFARGKVTRCPMWKEYWTLDSWPF